MLEGSEIDCIVRQHSSVSDDDGDGDGDGYEQCRCGVCYAIVYIVVASHGHCYVAGHGGDAKVISSPPSSVSLPTTI